MPSQTSHGSIYRPLVPQRTITDTAYTLVREDAGSDINMSNASACTITVPTNASVGFEIGEYINVHQIGAGQVTIVAGTGVTINTPETLKLSKQYAVATLEKKGTNTWALFGNLEAA